MYITSDYYIHRKAILTGLFIIIVLSFLDIVYECFKKNFIISLKFHLYCFVFLFWPAYIHTYLGSTIYNEKPVLFFLMYLMAQSVNIFRVMVYCMVKKDVNDNSFRFVHFENILLVVHVALCIFTQNKHEL